MESEKVEETIQEKAKKIKNNKMYYSYHDLWEWLEFYFKLKSDELNLYLNENNIWVFPKVIRSEIYVEKVHGSNYVFLSIW